MNCLLCKSVLFLSLLSIATTTDCLNATYDVEWQSLVKDDSLDGFMIREESFPADTVGPAKIEVKNGVITAHTYEKSSSTFINTRNWYGDFILELEVQTSSKFNSGIQIRSMYYWYDTEITAWKGNRKGKIPRKAGSLYGPQVEIANEKDDDRSGGIYDENGGRQWLDDLSDKPAAVKAYKKGDSWNKYRIECIGDHLKTYVNNIPCADVIDSKCLMGFIGLQVYGDMWKGEQKTVRWRNIRIQNLGRHDWVPIFDAKTLNGFKTIASGTWQIGNGIINASISADDKSDAILISDESFENFTVKADFKIIKGAASLCFGISKTGNKDSVKPLMVRLDDGKDLGAIFDAEKQDWLIKPHPMRSKNLIIPGEWNKVTLSAHNGRIVVHINDTMAVDTKLDSEKHKGQIALQLNSGQDTNVLFRNIEMLTPIRSKEDAQRVKMQTLRTKVPEPRWASEVKTVLSKSPGIPEALLEPVNIILLANRKDHGPFEHDYPKWRKKWSLLLGGKEAQPDESSANLYEYDSSVYVHNQNITEALPKVNVSKAWDWPTKEQFDSANVIVMFSLSDNQWTEQRIDQLGEYLDKGGGFVLIHPAIIPPAPLAEKLAEKIGMAWEWQGKYSRYRIGELNLKITNSNHPICLGLPETIQFFDEAYWPLKGDQSKINVLATSDERASRKSQEIKPFPMFWTYEYGKGKVFVCIPGHYTWTFDDPYFRLLLLRGVAWAAGQQPSRFDGAAIRAAPIKK